MDREAPVPGDTINFQATTSATGPLQWKWYFDATKPDPKAGNSPQAARAYPTRGMHYTAVQVTDGKGNSGVAWKRFAVGNPPTASFTTDPASPQPGQSVTFTSTASSPDRDGQIKSYAWDLNGDGKYDDGTDPTAKKTFDAEGQYTVGLRVVDDLGLSATRTETVVVAVPRPPQPEPQPQSTGDSGGFDTPPPAADTTPANPLTPTLAQFDPKPFVRVKGHTTGKGAQIDLLSVRAARGAHVWVRCAGKKCPKHKSQVRVVKTKKKVGTVRFRRIEGWFRAGTRLEVRVTKQGFIGRYTRFRIGMLKPPVRWDGCLMPGATGPKEC